MLRYATVGMTAALLILGGAATPFAHVHPHSHASGAPAPGHPHGHEAATPDAVHWHLAQHAHGNAAARVLQPETEEVVVLVSVAVERPTVRADHTDATMPAVGTRAPVETSWAPAVAPDLHPIPPPPLTHSTRAPPR